jgi:multidrug resistance efflux pump
MAESAQTIISAEGEVVPIQYAQLSTSVGGLVESVLVNKGGFIQQGEAIARLENEEQAQAAITAAELELLAAQQALDDLKDDAEIDAAQAAKEVADGRDAVRDAQQRIDNLNTASPEADISAAHAAMILARDKLDHAQEDFNPYEKKPEDNLRRAALENKLAQAQKEYDATVRRYNNLRGTANEIDLAQAQADLSLAEIKLQEAEENYETLRQGPDPDELEMATARVENAEAQLMAARAALQDLELRAPFDGSVVSLDLKVGEYVLPGVNLLLLADLSAWQVETTDLAEVNVIYLEEGMPASISLDAFPGQEFTAAIRSIDQRGEDQRGDITYTVTLDFEPGSVPVKWGMTAFVNIPLPK